MSFYCRLSPNRNRHLFRTPQGPAQWYRILETGLLTLLLQGTLGLAQSGWANEPADQGSVLADAADASYRLAARDAVSVRVFGEPDLTKRQRLDGEGTIRMDLIGTITLAGLTIREAETRIERAFREQLFLRDPQVSLSIEAYAPRHISILGEVENPGRVELEEELNGMRLVDAISAVGGLNGIAKGDAVRLTRLGPDGQEVTVVINAEAIISGRPSNTDAQYLTLLPGDVLFVPERLF